MLNALSYNTFTQAPCERLSMLSYTTGHRLGAWRLTLVLGAWRLALGAFAWRLSYMGQIKNIHSISYQLGQNHFYRITKKYPSYILSNLIRNLLSVNTPRFLMSVEGERIFLNLSENLGGMR